MKFLIEIVWRDFASRTIDSHRFHLFLRSGRNHIRVLPASLSRVRTSLFLGKSKIASRIENGISARVLEMARGKRRKKRKAINIPRKRARRVTLFARCREDTKTRLERNGGS